MSADRSVTDLETTALENALHVIEGVGVLIPGADTEHAADCGGCKVVAAVRELARQLRAAVQDRDSARKAADNYRIGMDEWKREADAFEADRDRLQAEITNAQRNYLRLVDEHKAEHERAQTLRDALGNVVNTLGPDHFGGELEGLVAEGNEALRIARAALAAPDTPPDAPTEGGDET